MKKLITLVALSLSCYTVLSQVGINNTNPQAGLDITASNVATPSNTDGILIPRIDEFPVVSPTVAQDGMLVFVTGVGTPTEGFYYWDQGTTAWVTIGGSGTQNTLDEAYDEGGAGIGRVITADAGALEIQDTGGLRVEGDITAGANVIHDGDTDTFISFNPDRITLDAGGRNYLDIEHANQEVTFNEDSEESDFRIESGTNQNMFFLDGSADAIGIGTNNPISPLHIGTQTAFDLDHANIGQDGLFIIGGGDNSGQHAVGGSLVLSPPNTTRANQRKSAISSVQTSGDVDHTGLAFYVHGNAINQSPMVERMRLNHQGFLGLNTITPSATLDVVGSMRFEDGNEATGFVLTSDATGNAIWTDPATIGDNDWTEVGLDIERQAGDVYIGDTNVTNNDLYISDHIIDWDNVLYSLDPDDVSTMDEIQFDDGGITDPSIRFSSTSSGFYSPGTNLTAYTTNAMEAFRIQTDGELSLGLTAPSDYLLSIQSDLSDIRIGRTVPTDNHLTINHASGFGDGLDINVTSAYNLASRSAISAFNDYLHDTAVEIARFISGSADSYGVQVNIPGNTIGIEYGLYSNVQTVNGFAGYFLGDLAVGTAPGNTYTLPASRGTNGQVMETDGVGNLSWVTPTNSITASNGLTATAGNVTLGGTLTQNTTITQGAFDLNFNLTNTLGNFTVDGTALVVESTGDVGLGLANPAYDLDVFGSEATSYVANFRNNTASGNEDGIAIRLQSGTNVNNHFIDFYRTAGAVNSGSVRSTGTGVFYATTSDRRLKTNIIDISNALETIAQIQPRLYEYKEFRGKKEFGFIAQELKQVYPQAVAGEETDDPQTSPMMVDYGRLTPILTAGVKELHDRLKSLEADNKALKKQLEAYQDFEKRLKALEK